MDWLSHTLWSVTIVRKRNLLWLTIIFGLLPDVAYLFYILYKIFGSKVLVIESWTIPGEVWIQKISEAALVNFYYFTHSFIAAFWVFAILYFFKRDYLILSFPYVVHILLDIPAHCGLFAARFLYPFSDFHLCGFRFEEHTSIILPINYLILGVVNILIWQEKLAALASKIKRLVKIFSR